MNTETNNVIACVDGSGLSGAVCDYAAWISQRVNAPLKLLHTIDHHPETAAITDLSGNIGVDSRDHLLEDIIRIEQQHSKLRLQQGKTLLQTAKKRVMQNGIADPIISQRHGNLVESLIELEDSIRVLVIGLRGKGHDNQPGQIGAKLESIIRSLHKPILVVNEAFKSPQRIMLAYDGSNSAEKAVDMVASSPLYKGLTCHLVCVSKDEATSQKLLDAAANKIIQAGGIDLITQKLSGKIDQALCDYQAGQAIDMTIMGAYSHTRLHDMLLGSFTTKMLLSTRKPLLLLR